MIVRAWSPSEIVTRETAAYEYLGYWKYPNGAAAIFRCRYCKRFLKPEGDDPCKREVCQALALLCRADWN